MKPLNEDGPSKIVPVKMSETMKTEAIEACDKGESLSSFVRAAVQDRIRKKWKQRKRKVR